jgi:hypothetical protein
LRLELPTSNVVGGCIVPPWAKPNHLANNASRKVAYNETVITLLLAATLGMTQEPARKAMVLPIQRLEASAPDAERWNRVALRAEATSEALLRHHGFKVIVPSEIPEFTAAKPAEARLALTAAMIGGSLDVVVGIRILGMSSESPMPYLPPIDVDLSKKGKIEPESYSPKYNEARAEVKLNVWLQVAGQRSPFISDKRPSAAACGVCSEDRLLGEAAQKCVEDVMRRFIRLHGDGRPID